MELEKSFHLVEYTPVSQPVQFNELGPFELSSVVICSDSQVAFTPLALELCFVLVQTENIIRMEKVEFGVDEKQNEWER